MKKIIICAILLANILNVFNAYSKEPVININISGGKITENSDKKIVTYRDVTQRMHYGFFTGRPKYTITCEGKGDNFCQAYIEGEVQTFGDDKNGITYNCNNFVGTYNFLINEMFDEYSTSNYSGSVSKTVYAKSNEGDFNYIVFLLEWNLDEKCNGEAMISATIVKQ